LNEESQAERELRLGSAARGVIIGALMAFYYYVTHQAGATLTVTLLVAAALQVAVLLLRRFVPGYLQAQVIHLFELLVDAATVLLFALGVFGGILRLDSIA
jgi:hypothetical protein